MSLYEVANTSNWSKVGGLGDGEALLPFNTTSFDGTPTVIFLQKYQAT
jgi:hypothetical protein